MNMKGIIKKQLTAISSLLKTIQENDETADRLLLVFKKLDEVMELLEEEEDDITSSFQLRAEIRDREIDNKVIKQFIVPMLMYKSEIEKDQEIKVDIGTFSFNGT